MLLGAPVLAADAAIAANRIENGKAFSASCGTTTITTNIASSSSASGIFESLLEDKMTEPPFFYRISFVFKNYVYDRL
jgi:hypothetical protein